MSKGKIILAAARGVRRLLRRAPAKRPVAPRFSTFRQRHAKEQTKALDAYAIKVSLVTGTTTSAVALYAHAKKKRLTRRKLVIPSKAPVRHFNASKAINRTRKR